MITIFALHAIADRVYTFILGVVQGRQGDVLSHKVQGSCCWHLEA